MRSASLIVLALIVAVAAITVAVFTTVSDRQDAPAERGSENGSILRAFAGANIAESDDPRTLFQFGCRCMASGEPDRAIGWFSQAALRKDKRLAARSHYNLGTIFAQKARNLFGSEPATASRQIRQDGIALLTEALAHYRDAMDLDFSQADARYNLELIRLWIHRMEAIWSQRDRRDQRRQLSLLELLQRIEADQRDLRAQSLVLTAQPDSTGRREAAGKLGALEQLLSEEMGTLAKKILADVDISKPALSDELDKASQQPMIAMDAVEVLADLADEAQQEMLTASGRLQKGPLRETIEHQTRAVELLDEIYSSLPQPARQAGKQRPDRTLQSQNERADTDKLPGLVGKLPQNREKSSYARNEQDWSGHQLAAPGPSFQAERQGSLSAQHVEALLRQVRERQRQRHIMEKQLQPGQTQATTMEKDW